jgi:ATPase subunit of ABC transporter with duplicated ATPase domains
VKQRESLRAAIAAIDNEIFTLRVAQVEAVNQEHGDTVHLTLHQGTSAPNYTAELSNLLAGSRIRAQEEVAAAIAGTFPPAALIDVVESGIGQRFAEVLGRDPGQMNRVVAHLSENEGIYRLETEPPSARLEITMFDEGEPKPVETLSKGQKATALLPLILRPLPYPLIFDQPEDDLDNKFIAKLVHTLRSLKQRRQLIFVTHNANIPVLGDADRVIVMNMATPTRAASPEIGTVDETKQAILDLLEGGAKAFREREAKYGELLRS